MSEEIRKIVPPALYQIHFSAIVFKTGFSNCVHKALGLRQWKEHEVGPWTLQWCEKERVNDVFEEGITGAQRVNHFRLYTQLCRKDMLMKNVRKHKRELAKQKKLVEAEWDFLPATYFLPSQYIMFVEDFKKRGGLWIMKPTGRCQGSGIFLVNKISQIALYRTKTLQNTGASTQPAPKKRKVEKEEESEDEQKENEQEAKNDEEEVNPNETFLIQKYLDEPLLFGSKKFDMRIYVLVTDYRNLTVWLYRSGFARFTHEPYNPEDIENLGGHLTNVQIQKHCENYDPVRGGKWLLNEFKLFLCSRFGRPAVEKAFWQIKDIILKSLLSVQKSVLSSKSSFELYGYDFMLDHALKPWLIEVNGGPSMTANTQFDCQLKCGLIDDALSIIDLEGILSGEEMTVGGFDLIMKKDVIVEEDGRKEVRCHLGSKNERMKVMRHIGVSFMTRKDRQKEQERQVELDKERKKKKKEETKENKKEKLLPDFYYNRKKEDAIDEPILHLKNELRVIEANEGNGHFTPLKASI